MPASNVAASSNAAPILVSYVHHKEPVQPHHAYPLPVLWIEGCSTTSNQFDSVLKYRRWLLGFGVRRNVFEAVGGFPEIPLMEDVVFARGCRRQGRICRLPLEIRTSARRFESRPLRTGLMFAVFPTLYRIGVGPQTLARWYGTVR